MAIVFGRPRGEILGALRKLVLLSWVPIHEGGSEAEAICPDPWPATGPVTSPPR